MNDILHQRQCPVCGKMFWAASMHSLTDGNGNLVCSCHCSTAAYEQRKQKKEERRKRLEQKQDDREREEALQWYYAHKGKKLSPGMRTPSPVEMIKKTGEVMKRYPTMGEASKDTGFSINYISRVCRGLSVTKGDYTFKYANEGG
jgi:hypothetical protein